MRKGVGMNSATQTGFVKCGFSATGCGRRRVSAAAMALLLGPLATLGGGLAQYWAFDDGSGATATNKVTGGNAGTLVNFSGGGWDTDVPSSLAHSGGSLVFDYTGTNYVNCGHVGLASTGGVDSVTVSLWMKPDYVVTDMRLWDPLRAALKAPHPLGIIRFATSGGSFALQGFHPAANAWTNVSYYGAVATNQWQHVGVTWKNKKLVTYINGNLVGGCAATVFEFDRDSFGDTIGFGLGAKYFTYGTSYDGKMDDVSLWDEALSPERIRALAAGASPLSLPAASPLRAPPRPLAEYRFDGNALDARGHYDASAVNGASFTNGTGNTPFDSAGNMALRLDGANDEVTLPNVAALRPGTKAWTVALWFKAAAADQMGILIANRKNGSPYTQVSIGVGGSAVGTVGAGRQIHTFLIGNLSYQVGRWESVTSENYADGNWHHAAMVREGNALSPILYVDGEAAPITVLNRSGALLDVDSADPWRIGSNGTAGNYFAGLLDEAALWDTALTGEEVAWLAKNSLAAIPLRGTLLRVQ